MAIKNHPRTEMSNIPIPDPTLLTTQQIKESVACLRESLEPRLKANDERLAQLRAELDRLWPAEVAKLVANLQALHEEKFRSIAVQFQERDTRAEGTSRDNNVAVNAAFAAAKEAVAEQNKSSALSITKSETATAKQIDTISAQMNAQTAAQNDKFDDIKARLTLIEGRGEGMVASRAHTEGADSRNISQNTLWVMAVIGILGTIIGVIGIVLHVKG